MTKRDEIAACLTMLAIGVAMIAGSLAWLFGAAWGVLSIGVGLVAIALLGIG